MPRVAQATIHGRVGLSARGCRLRGWHHRRAGPASLLARASRGRARRTCGARIARKATPTAPPPSSTRTVLATCAEAEAPEQQRRRRRSRCCRRTLWATPEPLRGVAGVVHVVRDCSTRLFGYAGVLAVSRQEEARRSGRSRDCLALGANAPFVWLVPGRNVCAAVTGAPDQYQAARHEPREQQHRR